MDADVELNVSCLVDEGTKTDTMRTGPGAICGTLSAPSSSRSCSCDVCAHAHIFCNLTHSGQLPKPKYTKSLKQRTTQWRDILVGKLVRVLSSDRRQTIVIRITDVEFLSFDQLSDEAINTEGLPSHLTSAEKRVLLRRIMHTCHNGHTDFDDSCVVFLIRFFRRFGNTRISCYTRRTVETLLGPFLGFHITFGVLIYWLHTKNT